MAEAQNILHTDILTPLPLLLRRWHSASSLPSEEADLTAATGQQAGRASRFLLSSFGRLPLLRSDKHDPYHARRPAPAFPPRRPLRPPRRAAMHHVTVLHRSTDSLGRREVNPASHDSANQ